MPEQPHTSRRRWLAAAGSLLAAPGLGLAQPPQPLFGGPVDLLLPGRLPGATEAAVWRRLGAIHRAWNAWKPGELQALNAALRAGRSHPVAPALRQVLQQAARLEAASGGLFNPGIGGLVGAWGFHADLLQPGPAPAAAVLAPWRQAAPSLAGLRWQGSRAHSTGPALQIDLGAYAKGVAIDAALDALQQRGVAQALLNLGGNLAAMGAADGSGRPWRVGIRHPLRPGLLATVHTRGREAVVTSGSYERFRLVGGQPACHILDPRLGAPVPAGAAAQALVSVTVLHPSAALADAAATALLVAGPAHWPALAARLGVAQVLVVDAQGRSRASAALAPRLQWV